jgi:uncharacterized protein (DUF1800 family)
MNASVDALLNFANVAPDPPINYYEPQNPDENKLPYGLDWTKNVFKSNGANTNNFRSKVLQSWNLGRTINRELNIQEKMALFWYHFIPVDYNVVRTSSSPFTGSNSAKICYNYMKFFRDNCVRNFKTIILNIATQPAMMYYFANVVYIMHIDWNGNSYNKKIVTR